MDCCGCAWTSDGSSAVDFVGGELEQLGRGAAVDSLRPWCRRGVAFPCLASCVPCGRRQSHALVVNTMFWDGDSSVRVVDVEPRGCGIRWMCVCGRWGLVSRLVVVRRKKGLEIYARWSARRHLLRQGELVSGSIGRRSPSSGTEGSR